MQLPGEPLPIEGQRFACIPLLVRHLLHNRARWHRDCEGDLATPMPTSKPPKILISGTNSKAVTRRRLSENAESSGETDSAIDAIVGNRGKMQEVSQKIGRLAEQLVPALIRGETGCGKDLVARAIYRYSKRADKPFVTVNCASIPDTLIDSELFGLEKGAIAQRIGRLEQASGGTLFLNEVGDLPWQTQVKLLRVLQEKVISRVGGKAEISIDVRIISATHRNLEKMIVDGKYREDLFFRLNAATISVPALRDRLEDLNQLASYFAAKHAKELEIDVPDIPREAMERLTQHYWPGNDRELEEIIRRALIESRRRTISKYIINDLLKPAPSAQDRMVSSTADSGQGFENHIREVLLLASHGDLDERGALPFLTGELERVLYQQAVVLSRGNQHPGEARGHAGSMH